MLGLFHAWKCYSELLFDLSTDHLVRWSSLFYDQFGLEDLLEDQREYEQPEETRSHQEEGLEQDEDPALVVLDVGHLSQFALSLFYLLSPLSTYQI